MRKSKLYTWFLLITFLNHWIIFYFNLQRFTNWVIDDIFKLTQGKSFTEAFRFFIFQVPQVLLLLVMVMFVAGIIQSFFSPERTRKVLERSWLYEVNAVHAKEEREKITLNDRLRSGYITAKETLAKAWIYIVMGIAVGAVAHGFAYPY